MNSMESGGDWLCRLQVYGPGDMPGMENETEDDSFRTWQMLPAGSQSPLQITISQVYEDPHHGPLWSSHMISGSL
jgi:hypothetical protein